METKHINIVKKKITGTCIVKSVSGEILYEGSAEGLPSVILIDDKVGVKIGLTYFDVDTVDTINGQILAKIF
jgi:hypothetical protein